MAKQAAKGTVIPKNLSNINKSKKKEGIKFLAQKVKDSDPNSLETVFKKKKNRKTKHKNRDKLKKNIDNVKVIDKEVPSM